MTRLRFMAAPRQNRFWVELATALVEEVRAAGGEASLEVGPLPDPAPGDVFVLCPPHEYAALLPGHEPTPEQLGRCILICGERPTTAFFDANLPMGRVAGAVFDINQSGAEALVAAGLPAQALTMGWTPSWDRFDPAAERDVDIAFIGSLTPRRARILSSVFDECAGLRCELVVSDNLRGPNAAAGPSYLDEEAKRALLARTRVLLNVHQDGGIVHFERLRAVQAACCGAVVLTEAGDDVSPFAAESEVALAAPERLLAGAAELARDTARLEALRTAAYATVREREPLADAARLLLAAAPAVASHPWPGRRTIPAAPAPAWESGPTIQPARLRTGLRALLGRLTGRRPEPSGDEPVLLAPAGCTLRADAVSRLREALASRPGAAFAYGVSTRAAAGDVTLDGVFGWEPGRRRQGDLVDGPILAAPEALRAAARAPGGRTDPRAVLVASAVEAVHVRDVLARLGGAGPARG